VDMDGTLGLSGGQASTGTVTTTHRYWRKSSLLIQRDVFAEVLSSVLASTRPHLQSAKKLQLLATV
jgi:hypothetical protein